MYRRMWYIPVAVKYSLLSHVHVQRTDELEIYKTGYKWAFLTDLSRSDLILQCACSFFDNVCIPIQYRAVATLALQKPGLVATRLGQTGAA